MNERITSPFPGLRPFQDEESEIFFGRSEQIVSMLGELETHRFLAVVGASGSGKSSLVRAGLLPALRQGFLAGAEENWLFIKMSPGAAPFTKLARAFHTVVRGAEPDPDELALEEARMRRGRTALAEAVAGARLPENTSVLLLVDQFEEIFRFSRHGVGSQRIEPEEEETLTKEERAKLDRRRQQAYTERNDAAAFVNLMLETAWQEEFPIHVVLTMRSDFIGYCDAFHGLPEAMNKSQFLTPRMRRDQAREAVEGPLAVFGAAATPELVNEVLNEIGSDPDQLPLMQHLLARMWSVASRKAGSDGRKKGLIAGIFRRNKGGKPSGEEVLTLTLEDYERMGGLKGALSAHANQAFEELGDEEGCKKKRIAEAMFRSLCDRGYEGQLTRRNPPPSVKSIAAVAGVSWEEVAAVAEPFLRPGRSFIYGNPAPPLGPDSKLDISHEALIRQWKLMRKWAKAEADSAETYLELVKAARRWKNGEGRRWTSYDLKRGLLWRKTQRPTQAWANRYDSDLPVARSFLAKSRSLRETKFSLVLAGVLAVLVLGGFVLKDTWEETWEDTWETRKDDLVAKEVKLNAKKINAANEKEVAIVEAKKKAAIEDAADSNMEVARARMEEGKILEGLMRYWRAFELYEAGNPKREGVRDLIAAWSREAGFPLIHDGPVLALAFNREGTILVTLSEVRSDNENRRSVCFWRIKSAHGASLIGQPVLIDVSAFAAGFDQGVRSWVLTPGGEFRYVARPPADEGSEPYQLKRLRVAGDDVKEDIDPLEGSRTGNPRFGWSPDGRILAEWSGKKIQAWSGLFGSREMKRLVSATALPVVINDEGQSAGDGERPGRTLPPMVAFSRDASLMAVGNVAALEVGDGDDSGGSGPEVDASHFSVYRFKGAGAGSGSAYPVVGPSELRNIRFSRDGREVAVVWVPARERQSAGRDANVQQAVVPNPEGPTAPVGGPDADDPAAKPAPVVLAWNELWGGGRRPVAVERFKIVEAGLEKLGIAEPAFPPVGLLFAPSAGEGGMADTTAPLQLYCAFGDGSIGAWVAGGRENAVETWSPLRLDEKDPGHRALMVSGVITRPHAKEITAATLSSDGTSIITGSKDWNVRFRDLEGFPSPRSLVHAGEVTAIAVDPTDRGLVATASRDRTVRLWPPAAGEPDLIVPLENDGMRVLVEADSMPAFSQDGDTVFVPGAVGVDPNELVGRWEKKFAGGALLDLRNGPGDGSGLRPLSLSEFSSGTKIRKSGPAVFASRFGSTGSGPGEFFFSSSSAGTVHLWDRRSGQEITSGELAREQWNEDLVIGSVAAGGGFLLTGSVGPEVVLWDIASGDRVWGLDVTTGEVGKTAAGAGDPDSLVWVSCHPVDPDRFVTGGPDGWVRVWKRRGDSCELLTRMRHADVTDENDVDVIVVDIKASGDRIISSGAGGAVKLWNFSDGQPVTSGFGSYADLSFAFYDAGGTRLLTYGSSEGGFGVSGQLWNAATGHPLGSRLDFQDSFAIVRPDGGAVAYMEDPNERAAVPLASVASLPQGSGPPTGPTPAPDAVSQFAPTPDAKPAPGADGEPGNAPHQLVLYTIPLPDANESDEALKLRMEVLTGKSHGEKQDVFSLSQEAWLDKLGQLERGEFAAAAGDK